MLSSRYTWMGHPEKNTSETGMLYSNMQNEDILQGTFVSLEATALVKTVCNIPYVRSGKASEFCAIICCCLLNSCHSNCRLSSARCFHLARSCRYALRIYRIACASAGSHSCILKTAFVSQTKRPDSFCVNIKTPSLCCGKELQGGGEEKKQPPKPEHHQTPNHFLMNPVTESKEFSFHSWFYALM